MARNDWVPGREQDVTDLLEKWKMVLSDPAKVSAFGWDGNEVSAVLGKITAYTTARTAYEQDRTPDKRLAKDESRDAAVKAIRVFANSSVRYNPKMADPDKLVLGIHPKDATPTPHTPPTSQPDLLVEHTKNRFEHLIRAVNRDTGTPVKPEDAYGVRYAWQIGGTKPASGADLPKTKFSRKTSLTISHTEGDKAQTAYYAACYENTRGDFGSWSQIEEALIG